MRIEHGGYEYRTFLGSTDSFKVVDMIIHKFLASNHIRSYYQIMNFESPAWRLDYGSHSKFIWISELPENAEELYIKEHKKNDSSGGKNSIG